MNERYAEALREAAAEFLAREANRNTLITVTRTELSDNGQRAVIFITVYPVGGDPSRQSEAEAEKAALAFANRNRGELGTFLSKRTRGMRLPHLEFRIDLGDKNRRRLDELSPQ